MKLSQFFLIAALSVTISTVTILSVSHSSIQESPKSLAHHETSYERVVRTGVLRCGYQYWDSAVMRNEKSNQLSGAWVDITNALGKATGLNIEWTAQVGWDEVGAALKSSKIDAMCAGMWTSAAKAKEINFSTPLAYQAIEVFVREDDHRFDNNLTLLNDPKIHFAVIDNDNSDFIAQQDFPKAGRSSLGQMNGTDADLLMYVMTNKSDATFTVTGEWRRFDANNKGKVRRLAPNTRLRVFGLALAVDNDDARLLNLINAGAEEIKNSGFLDKILDQANQAYPDMYIKPLKPYP